MLNIIVVLLLLFFSNNVIDSRYISYSKPNYYKTNDKIPVYMNNVRSGLSIFDYYKYPFPKPSTIEYKQSFMSKLAGDLNSTSLYDEVSLFTSVNCIALGKPINYTLDDVNQLKYLIDKHFRINFFIDDLPIGELFKNNRLVEYNNSDSKSSEITPSPSPSLSSLSSSSSTEEEEEEEEDTENEHIYLGHPIGFKYNSKYYLYNHLIIFINSTSTKSDKVFFTIKSVNVEPYSCVDCKIDSGIGGVEISPELFDDDKNKQLTIQYTYSIRNHETTTTNSGKSFQSWSIYYVNQFKLSNIDIIMSFIIVLAVSACLAIILLKIFRKTNSKTYTQLSPDDGGWKSIYADVFRSPNNFMTFSIIIGFGVQIVASLFILMVFSVAGLTSIATPGGMAIASILIFSFTGIFNGYSSMRTYIMLGGTRKLYNSVITTTLIPFTILLLMFIGYFQVWSNKFTYGASIGTVFFILAMWLFVCVPCSLLSSYFVRTWPPAEYPVRTNPIPRFIPTAKWYQNQYLHMILGGAIPFVIIFTELSFFLSSWVLGEHYSYSLSFALTFILMIISIVETNMIIEYYQLSLENYNWWWRSLLGPMVTGLYTFIYFIYFGITRIETEGVGFYYFMFSLVFSILVSLFCSSIGFLGNLWFTKKIYSTLHFD
ncbi:hypothetical protein ACTFIW_008478 [Dictyostelium discoideum]